MFNRPLILMLVLAAACLLAGCPQPSVKDIQSEQIKRLDSMQAEAASISDPAERQRFLEEIAALRKEIESSHGTLDAQQRELEALRREHLAFRLSREVTAASVEMPYFSPVAGPRGLDLWVIPRDSHGDAVKVPGTIAVSVHHPGALGLGSDPNILASWTLNPSQLQDKWAGQLYQGYHVVLPWPDNRRPAFAQVVVRVTFISPDGKSCKAEKPVDVKE